MFTLHVVLCEPFTRACKRTERGRGTHCSLWLPCAVGAVSCGTSGCCTSACCCCLQAAAAGQAAVSPPLPPTLSIRRPRHMAMVTGRPRMAGGR
eukprot:202290-Chlamydomonas_euryale.AAC.5